MRAKQIGILVCLIMVGCMLFAGKNNAYAGDSFVVLSQISPLTSPLTMVQPMAQSSQETAENIQSFKQQLPYYSGSQANQTSLVLIGAVLIGLVVVGTLVINRK